MSADTEWHTCEPEDLPRPAYMRGITAAELMGKTFPPFRWIVHGYVVEGLTLLAGAPKARKSWMMLDVAHAVATGGYALGTAHCEHGDVLFLALEDNQRRLQDRLRKMGVTEPPERLRFCTEWPTGEDAVAQIEAWAHSVEKPVLAVVDVLARVRDFTGRDPSYEADYRALVALHDLATRLGLAIVVIHHTRKSVADDPFDEVSGTRGLTGAADTVLVIKRDNTGGPSFRATLYGRGRDIPEVETAIEFIDEDYRWKILGDAGQVADTVEQQQILDLLRQAGAPKKVKEVAELVGKSVANVSKMLVKMAKAGLVSNPAFGSYGPVEVVEPVEVGGAWGGGTSTTSTTSTACQGCAGSGCKWCEGASA